MSLEHVFGETEEWPEGFRWKLKCPQCNFDYIHLLSVVVLRGTDQTRISSEGIFVQEAENRMRGVRISIEYHCENGHHGRIIMQFYKGNVFVEHENLPIVTAERGHDIWRS